MICRSTYHCPRRATLLVLALLVFLSLALQYRSTTASEAQTSKQDLPNHPTHTAKETDETNDMIHSKSDTQTNENNDAGSEGVSMVEDEGSDLKDNDGVDSNPFESSSQSEDMSQESDPMEKSTVLYIIKAEKLFNIVKRNPDSLAIKLEDGKNLMLLHLDNIGYLIAVPTKELKSDDFKLYISLKAGDITLQNAGFSIHEIAEPFTETHILTVETDILRMLGNANQFTFESIQGFENFLEKLIQKIFFENSSPLMKKHPSSSLPELLRELYSDDEFASTSKKVEVMDETTKKILQLVSEADEILKDRSQSIAKAISLYESAINLGDSNSLTTLASMCILGVDKRFKYNVARGVVFLQQALGKGNPNAQALYAFLLSTGFVGEHIPRDEPRSILYYTLAASGGSFYAQMALGFRYLYGIGVDQDDLKAATYFELGANQIIKTPEGQNLLDNFQNVEKHRLSDEVRSRKNGEHDEIVQYYKHSAIRGDVQAQVEIGQLYYIGGHGIRQNMNVAREFFERAANAGNPVAHGILGYMYAKGLGGLKVDNESAVHHFRLAAEQNDPAGLNGMGYMYAYGMGVEVDKVQAARYFTKAAELGHAEAMYNLATMLLTGEGVPQSSDRAYAYFNEAAKRGHIRATYHTGLLIFRSASAVIPKDLFRAAQMLKKVCQHGALSFLFPVAFDSYLSGDYRSALFRYMFLAHAGYETAQFNSGFICERMLGPKNITGSSCAIEMYKLAAHQGNLDATLRIGDLLYDHNENYNEAAVYYQKAARLGNAEAVFNLGVMHAFGIGFQQDFHMAKRYFDTAKSISTDAEIPCRLAQYAMHLFSNRQNMLKSLLNIYKPLSNTLSGKKSHKGSGSMTSENVSQYNPASGIPFSKSDVVLIGILFALLAFVLNARQRRMMPQ